MKNNQTEQGTQQSGQETDAAPFRVRNIQRKRPGLGLWPKVHYKKGKLTIKGLYRTKLSDKISLYITTTFFAVPFAALSGIFLMIKDIYSNGINIPLINEEAIFRVRAAIDHFLIEHIPFLDFAGVPVEGVAHPPLMFGLLVNLSAWGIACIVVGKNQHYLQDWISRVCGGRMRIVIRPGFIDVPKKTIGRSDFSFKHAEHIKLMAPIGNQPEEASLVLQYDAHISKLGKFRDVERCGQFASTVNYLLNELKPINDKEEFEQTVRKWTGDL